MKLLQAKRDSSLGLTEADVVWLVHMCNCHYTGVLKTRVVSVRADGRSLFGVGAGDAQTSLTKLAITKFSKHVA